MILKLFIIFLIRTTICQDVTSKHNQGGKTSDNDSPYGNPSYRRFIDDLDDKEWHLAHLKETDNLLQSECAGDTLEDKIQKYKKVLKNDAARVEYVYADPLPFDKNDFFTSGKCHAPHAPDVSKVKVSGPEEHSKNRLSIASNNETTKSNIKEIKSNINETKSNINETKSNISETKSNINETKSNIKVPEEVNSATTVKIDSKDKRPESNTTEAKKNRRSEYQFSSIEYYDETIDFDDSMCPDTVEVIKLEVDQLRNYDVECELLLEWRSLDN